MSSHDPALSPRLSTVLDAVEQAASAILEEAEADARRTIAAAETEAERIVRAREAEVARASDGLLDLANGVREKADELLRLLDGTIDALGAAPAASSVAAKRPEEQGHRAAGAEGPDPIRALRERLSQMARPPATLPPAGRKFGDDSPAAEQGRERPGAGKPAEGAVLLAMQMAVAGSRREQIRAALRDDFGIEDPTAILDEIGA